MPFTFSHPALVLPAKYLPERWVSMTGLIVGSVTPDFEYFVRMRVESNFSHTWTGIFWFDLPLAILLSFIYHYMVRNSFICNLPVFLKRKLSRYMNFNWMDYFKHNFLKVIICFIIGITSHILWDGFTHLHGNFVRAIPSLRESTTIEGFRFMNYNILQNLSSLVGGIIVIYVILSIPSATNYAKARNPFYYWFIVIGTGIVAANFRILLGSVHYWEYYTVATSTLSGFIAGAIIAPLFLEKGAAKIT